MRPIITLVLTCAFMACVSVPVGATMAASMKPRYSTCNALAVKSGITTKNDRRPAGEPTSEYERFMTTCLTSKVESTSAQKSERWTNCIRHRIGTEGYEYQSSDQWLQVIVSCL